MINVLYSVEWGSELEYNYFFTRQGIVQGCPVIKWFPLQTMPRVVSFRDFKFKFSERYPRPCRGSSPLPRPEGVFRCPRFATACSGIRTRQQKKKSLYWAITTRTLVSVNLIRRDSFYRQNGKKCLGLIEGRIPVYTDFTLYKCQYIEEKILIV